MVVFLTEQLILSLMITNISGVIVIGCDITEQKQAEEKLGEREKKYRNLLETTSEGCWIINPELKTIKVNEALCNMLGYSQDEMIGKTPFDFVDDENRKIFIEQTSKISTTPHRSYEITLKKKNGQGLPTRSLKVLMHHSNMLFLYAIEGKISKNILYR